MAQRLILLVWNLGWNNMGFFWGPFACVYGHCVNSLATSSGQCWTCNSRTRSSSARPNSLVSHWHCYKSSEGEPSPSVTDFLFVCFSLWAFFNARQAQYWLICMPWDKFWNVISEWGLTAIELPGADDFVYLVFWSILVFTFTVLKF